MKRLKELAQRQSAHERIVEYRTYPLAEGKILVEGSLKDRRMMDGYNWCGDPQPPGTIHHICVRLLMGDWPLAVLDAEGEFITTPYEHCHSLEEVVSRLVGITIKSGYSDEVIQRIGGIHGCSHLTHLIIGMGPAALHGYWSARSLKRPECPRSIEEMQGLPYLLNSCKFWQADGPNINIVKDLIAKKYQPDESI